MTASAGPGSAVAAARRGVAGLRRGETLARVAAWIAFAVLVYAVGYRPSGMADAYFDVNAQLGNTIRAANDGYPFAAYAPREPSRVVRIDQFASGYYDPGLPALVSATALAGRAVVGPHFRVDRRAIYRSVLAMCLLAGLVLVGPALPLPVSLAGLTALAAAILIPVSGQHAFNWPRWWEAYSAVLVGMLIVGLFVARRGRWSIAYFAGLTLLAGYARLLREEVVVTTHGALGALVATLVVLAVVARWRVRSPAASAAIGHLLRRTLLVGAVFYAGLAAAPYLLRAAIATAWRIPFSATTTAVHGTGHSLYLSLGHVANPYGISWRDNVAMSHSHLIDPSVRIEDPRYQAVLQREALRIMAERPWLVRDNVRLNARETAVYLGATAAPRAIATLAALVCGAAIALLAWSRRPRLLALIGGLTGLGAGASAPALLIHPHYAFGTQAVLILVAFVAPFATWAVVRSEDGTDADGRVTGWTAAVCAGAALLLGAAVLGWSAVRTSRYAHDLQAVAASPQPLGDLQREGHRYASHFNDLPVATQARLIAALAASGDARVAVPAPAATIAGFRPVLAVATDRQLHVVAWLGREQPLGAMPVGSAFAFVATCVGCEQIRGDLPNDPYALVDAAVRLDVAAIHNHAWADRYQMLSVPLPQPLPPSVDVLLALQRIVGDDPATFAFVLQTDATWRARFR